MSIHIEAKKGEIAENVLLPGDPLRAKWIAENFFEDPKIYNNVRGMLGYTGTVNGTKISVQGTGMGVPSTLIYCTELIKDYGVKNLIRVGSAGSFQKEIKLYDIVIAMTASTTSAINRAVFADAGYSPTVSYELFRKAITFSEENNIKFHAGNVLTSDQFYEDEAEFYTKWAEYGVLCAEMETAGLYTVASKYGVNALSVLTISDSLVTKESTTSKERETSFRKMIEIALGALKY
ncbi:purine-nucleoside phosphorylase [Christiangramia fulva]|uniref:Uridine phosphorylase n=1 Tax=Christiangramia fulva TaxID=2126553 RepID=A0A2R3Z259_9FLAO|nr:purine-nucleoside phosphorylase [Christiangramia fulva]AVR44360.1 purine-nucleoside phosphorylase [Christiangramia fulva]